MKDLTPLRSGDIIELIHHASWPYCGNGCFKLKNR